VKQSPTAAGALLALFLLVGAGVGGVLGQPSAGLLIGGAAGGATALLLWWRERRRLGR
jgi:hypothetical protein